MCKLGQQVTTSAVLSAVRRYSQCENLTCVLQRGEWLSILWQTLRTYLPASNSPATGSQ